MVSPGISASTGTAVWAASLAADAPKSRSAISVGFAKGYEVSAGIALLALIVTLIAIRVRRSDLAGINPVAAPAD